MEQNDKERQAVLEGKFSVKIYQNYDDIALNNSHPFRPKVPLRPHDGCGFIRKRIADKLGIDIPKTKPSPSNAYLPAQALQHYTMDSSMEALKNEVEKNLKEAISNDLANLTPDTPAFGERLFRIVNSGGIKGKSLLALPSCDHNSYGSQLPNHILIGRAPYDQANLVAVQTSTASEDYNDNVYVVQYSFVAQDKVKDATGTLPMWFAKGLLVVIPDDSWPDDAKQADMVLSAADIKTHSSWNTEQEKDAFKNNRSNRLIEVGGILIAINGYPICDCIAVPIDSQKYLSGDFDGDKVLIIDGVRQPELYKHINYFNKNIDNQSKNTTRALKLNKTFTPARREGKDYVFGRCEAILSTKQQVLERFSTLQARFLTLDSKNRAKLETKCQLNIQEKIKKEGTSDLVPFAEQQLAAILSNGIKVGTDAYKSATAIPTYAKLGKLLQATFSREKINPCVPYGKPFARKMGNRKVDIGILRTQLGTNPTWAAKFMDISLKILKDKLEPY